MRPKLLKDPRRVVVLLPQEELDDLRARAAAAGVSMNELVREAIKAARAATSN